MRITLPVSTSAAQRCARALVLVLSLTLLGACGGGGGGGGGAADQGGSIVGVWTTGVMFDPAFGGAPFQEQLILQGDGSYQRQWIYAAGSVISQAGGWVLFPGSILKLNALSAQPASALVGGTFLWSMPDANTLVVDIPSCNSSFAVCRYIHSRG
jgi:hypothetical protein